VNDAWCDTTGYRREEVIGRSQRDLNIWNDADSQRFARQMREQGEVREFRFSFKRRLPSGRTATGHASLSAQPIELNGTMYSLVSGRDLTAEVEAESRRQQASRLEGLGRLAGGVAHDFNNLLTVIGAHALFAREAVEKGEPPQVDDLLEITRTTRRAAELTRRLLAFSRNQAIEPRVLDLNHLVREAGTLLQRLVPSNSELRVELSTALPPILADPTQVDQVLVNLVVNARDAIAGQGRIVLGTRSVTVAAWEQEGSSLPPDDYAVLEVSDTGSGIDEQTLEQIFQPFFTTKGLSGGTGLGLAMVYGIVKQAGGEIQVSSQIGYGTTFQIYWPAVAAVAQPTPVVPEAPQEGPGGGRVLLVEDDGPVRLAICRLLEERGYSVTEVRNGAEALRRITQSGSGSVDVVLTDVVMPVMDGRELAERLAEVAPELPVLMFSGYTERANVRAGLPNVRGPVLAKPIDENELLRALAAARAT